MKAGDQVASAGRRRDPAIDAAILKAGLDLFLRQGAEGLNFEQISTVTGISRATIYRRWKSRRELLNATLETARTSVGRNPSDLLNMPSNEIAPFLEDTIVLGLMSPMVPKLVIQLIGASSSHPGLLATWSRRTLEPGWQALLEVIAKARKKGAMPEAPDPELLRDLLAGAIINRLIFRTKEPNDRVERRWVRRLLGQLGLITDPE
jgi:AcrR family transcriptional regulator